MNIPLLRQIQEQILKEPKQFQMRHWFVGENSLDSLPEDIGYTIPNCGTAACIAGWAVSLSKGLRPSEVADEYMCPDELAAEQLDITNYQADNLFRFSKWPVKFKNKHNLSYLSSSESFDRLEPTERARLAVARIEHFIATEGKE